MQDALSHGPPNFNLKLRCLLPRLSTLPCHRHYVMLFLSWTYCRNEGAKLQGRLYQTLCLLQSIWRQRRSPGTRKASKATPKDQAHKCLLSSFSQTQVKGAYQDLPYQHQRPDCWCTHKSSTKQPPASLLPYVPFVTSLSQQSKGVLCNWKYFGTYLEILHISRDLVMRKVNKYFGTYLGHLPMIPMSPQCDTFQLIPISF